MPFVKHIDSIIQIILGSVFTWLAFRSSNKLPARTTKIFKICGPALIVVGGLLLLQPNSTASWERQLTSDKAASAEFPGPAVAQDTTDTVGTVSVKRTSFTYNVRGRDISLFLSYSTLPENARALTDAQRMQSTLAYFASQGSRVVRSETTGSIHRLTLRQDDNKITVQMALAYVGDNVYRVVASWGDGQEDKPLTDRFVNSFRISSK